MIGETILHYKILEKLGAGGMGVVYLAEDINLERKVALKFLPYSLSANSEGIERFKIEAKAAATLNHPNIATIYSIEEAENSRGDKEFFIAMEYVEGKDFKDIIAAGTSVPLPIHDVINYAMQIAEGLEAAHTKGIVHRDIKSQNIMVTDAEKIKIMDFGLAKITGRAQLTRMGTTVGTLAYMSPEHARGEDVDYRTDIWAFGVILYEMLTGKMPFNGKYEQVLIYSILYEEPEDLRIFRHDIPDNLLQVIKNSLEKDVENRYQSVGDLLIDLKKVSQNYSSKSQSPVQIKSTGKAASQKEPFFRKKVFITAVLIFLLAIAISIYFFLNNKNVDSDNITQKQSIAVMYFENIHDPADKNRTGDMITNLLITSLSQSKKVEVISNDQLYSILEDMGMADDQKITHKTAMKVAQNAGVSTILVGTVVQDTPSLAVTTRLIDVKSGSILGSQKLVGYKSEQIFSFVDSLAFLVKNELKITPSQISESKSVADVTTKSPEAYRAYVEGLNLNNKLYFKEADTAFKKAIELDSSFAMAYYYLGGFQNLKKAVELADNTTERERLLIFAKNYRMERKNTKAAEIYKQLIEKYPHQIEAYLGLLSTSGKEVSREDILLRGVRSNPSAKTLWNALALIFSYNNHKQKALSAVNEYIKLSPAEPNPYDTKGEIYARFMDYDSSAIYYKKAMEFNEEFGAFNLGCYDVLKGKYTEAQKYFDMSGIPPLNYPSINVHRGLLNSEIKRLRGFLTKKLGFSDYASTTAILLHLYYETGQYPKMLQLGEKIVNKVKKIRPKGTYGRDGLAWALVKNGKSKEAERIIENMIKNSDNSYSNVLPQAKFASAILLYEEGKYELAIEKFNEAFSMLMKPIHEPNIFYAICLLKTGQRSEAVTQFNRIKNWPIDYSSYELPYVPGAKFYSYINNVKAHYWLGVAYEKLGEKEKAISEYKTFLETWKDADFNSPELKDAKMRLQKLDS